MDVIKLLKNVNNINEYISVTQQFSSERTEPKVQVNITTALALKKIRSLEIEYLNKCEENGVACMVFERLLCLPPSQTWGFLGKELVSLLQYWLDAVRKHLINHSPHWWTFLKLLLKFIKEIRTKDKSIPNILVEYTSECLLALATAERCDVRQRHEILHCLNMFCAESGREVRFVLRNKFEDYFVKLSSYVRYCGDGGQQWVCVEALVRWLLPRQHAATRANALNRWFNDCPNAARDIFINTNWMNFYQDAREFLNALNDASGLVTSVVCKRLCIGNITVISGIEKQQSWLDINSGSKSLSVLLDPRVLDKFGVIDQKACETLMIDEQDTETAKLHRDPSLTLTVTTLRPPSVRPSLTQLGDDTHVTMMISSHTNLPRLDTALKQVFGDKYQLQFNFDSEASLSPLASNNKSEKGSEEDTRLSHPAEIRKQRRCGYVVKSKTNPGFASPSSVSTSSLAQLHEKLAALPRFNYDKEPISVCAPPQLSSVAELSERDERSFCSTSTLKLRPYGVCHRRVKVREVKHSQSDGETKQYSRILSPVVDEENNTSCLLVATVGSNDTVINETVERISKKKEFNNQNIVDLIVKEALQAEEKVSDSGINTDDNKKSQESIENSEAIENTPVQELEKSNRKKNRGNKTKKCAVVSKSTTDDESNTEAIAETPVFVNPRKYSRKNQEVQKQIIDEQTIENFFSQHFTENKDGQIVVSPTLARKINETSSEASDFDDQCLITNTEFNEELFQFNDIDIIECLNDIVDKVCNDLEKCAEIYDRDGNNFEIQPNNNMNDTKQSKTQKTPVKDKTKIKIKFQRTGKGKGRKKETTKKKIIEKSAVKMSTIIEQTDEDTILDPNNINNEITAYKSPEKTDLDTSNIRRKRKLYSPKDDIERKNTNIQESDDDIVLANIKRETKKSYKSAASCYKEIEKERKKFFRNTRNRKSKVQEPPSPRTSKLNAIFDQLKETVECTEKINLVDKTNKDNVYNFTSDSEDDDFKKKKIVTKKSSSTTVDSMPARRRRQVSRVNYSESKSSNDETKKTKTVKRKKPIKQTNKRKITSTIEENGLIDERMRETATDVLNTSLVIDQPAVVEETIEPKITETIEMEPITEEASKKIRKTKKQKPIKKEKYKKNQLKVIPYKDDDRTVSPLPGLVVETATKDDTNDSVTDTMAQKFRKIYYEGVNDTNNTQNMLSDIENNIHINITDHITDLTDNDKENNPRNTKHRKNKIEGTRVLSNDIQMEHQSKVVSIETVDERSIETNGITAHGDDDEHPPSPDMIQTRYQPREIEDLEGPTKDYFEQLIKAANASPNEKSGENFSKNLRKSLEKSPVISVKRLSLDDISKWLPSRRSTETETSLKSIQNTPKNTRTKSPSKSPVFPITKISLEEFDKWLPMPKRSDCKSPVELTKARTRSQCKNKELQKSQTSSVINKESERKSKTSIKPIAIDSNDDSDDECIKKIRSLFAKNKNNTKSKTIKSPIFSKDMPKSSDKTIKSPIFNEIRKRSSSPLLRFAKRFKADETVTVSDSAPSASCAEEWVKKSRRSFKEDESTQTTDVLQGVMEKLDTTLVEINRNTSKKFVNLFVEMQQQMVRQTEERQDMLKSAMTDVLTKCVEIMNNSFGELVSKSQQIEEQFMERLKAKAFDLVREDCKQKQAMVMILKEDVQAVIDHIENRNN